MCYKTSGAIVSVFAAYLVMYLAKSDDEENAVAPAACALSQGVES